MIKSHALVHDDFDTNWYKRWATELKQDKNHLDGHQLKANKFWQNAVICQVLEEYGLLREGKRGVGFGVGQERLPALFAKHHVEVLATDQDFHSKEAQHWFRQELATGQQSLNKLGICNQSDFSKYMSYKAVDMNNIPSTINNYDFLWTNCSIGHLGLISNGLEAIRSSLKCLKPGGVAVHTTEINILSNRDTVTTGDTVIFRLRDIYRLYTELTAAGYYCKPLIFNLVKSEEDNRISMKPKFGNDFSKIQVGGYLLTQVVLIIKKPRYRVESFINAKIRRPFIKYYCHKSLAAQEKYKKTNPKIIEIYNTLASLPEEIKLTPVEPDLNIQIAKNETKDLYINFVNNSPFNLYGRGGHLNGIFPIVLGTYNPKDRESTFADTSWISPNRVSSDFYVNDNSKTYKPLDHVATDQQFALKVRIDAAKAKPGTYNEKFSVVEEGRSWVSDSTVTIEIKVV